MPLKANDYHNHLKLKTKAQICYFLLFLSVFFPKNRLKILRLTKSCLYLHSETVCFANMRQGFDAERRGLF